MVDGGRELDGAAARAARARVPTATCCPRRRTARGADALGMRPRDGGLDTRAMLEAARDGKLGVLAILGANPMLRFPDRALVEAALRATPFVVVTELFMTETAEFADLVLPVCSAFEKSGTTTDLAGDVLPVDRIGARRPKGCWPTATSSSSWPSGWASRCRCRDEIEARVRELVRTPPRASGRADARAFGAAACGGDAARDRAADDLHRRRDARVRPAHRRAAHAAARDAASRHRRGARRSADGDLVDLTRGRRRDAARARRRRRPARPGRRGRAGRRARRPRRSTRSAPRAPCGSRRRW